MNGKSNICKSKTYIDEILRGTFFSFVHTEITIDPTDYEKAIQVYNGDSYTTVSNRFFKEMHHYFKLVDVITDSGIIFTSLESKTFIQTDNIKEMTDFRKADNFLSYSLKISTKKEIYKRSYIKLQAIAAELGGIIKSLTVICYIILYFYSKIRFYEYISDYFFDVRSNISDKKALVEIFGKRKNYTNSKLTNSQLKRQGEMAPISKIQENHFSDNNNNKIKSVSINNFLKEESGNQEKIQSKFIPEIKINDGNNNNNNHLNFEQSNNNFITEKKESNMNSNFIALNQENSNSPENFQNNNQGKIENSSKIEAENFIKYIKKEKKFFHLSFFEALFYPFFIRSKKASIKIMERVIEQTDEALDILRHLKDYIDFQRLKSIFFEKNEQKVFELPYLLSVFNSNKEIIQSNLNADNISIYKDGLKTKVIHDFRNIDFEYGKEMNEAIKNTYCGYGRSRNAEKLLKVVSPEIQNYIEYLGQEKI